jgi:glutaredoxin 3
MCGRSPHTSTVRAGEISRRVASAPDGNQTESSMSAKVEIYTGPSCGSCVAAKTLLKQRGLNYEEIRIDTDPVKRDEMLQRSGQRRTVPQIFINDQHIGGFEELAAADHSGKLAQIIGAAT